MTPQLPPDAKSEVVRLDARPGPVVLDLAKTAVIVVDMQNDFGAEGGMESSYSDITALSSDCRYRDCGHTGEPGCAVLDAVRSGKISREHLENYVKLRKESEFHQMSYAEKRKKDRNFGRFIKSAKKNLK